MRILLASSNGHKRHEFQLIFKGHEILLPSEAGIAFDCEEDRETFMENSLLKARTLYGQLKKAGTVGYSVMADDSGLLVPALPGLLGVRTARFGSEEGGPLLSAEERNALLLRMLEGKPDAERSAAFVCAITLIRDENTVYCVQESTEGRILRKKSDASGGFGYDPVFFCNEAGCAMAELPEDEKNRYSHRGKAARSILKLIGQGE